MTTEYMALVRTGRERGIVHVPPPGGDPPPEPSPQAIIFQASMNQSSGPMTDSALGNHMTMFGGVERSLDGLLTGSSKSAAFDGSSGFGVVSHLARYQNRADGVPVTSWTAVWWMQRDSDPADGTHMVMIAKAKQGESGRWDASAWNDGGTVRFRGNIGGVLIGASIGVHAIPAGTAFKFGIGYDASTGMGHLLVGGEGIVASQAIADGGLIFNTADLVYGGYNGGVGLFDGPADDLVLYDYWIGETAFNALDSATTIERDGEVDPPPPSGGEFSCPAQGGTLDTSHKNLGTVTSSRELVGGSNRKYDFTGSILTNTYNAGNNEYTPSYNIRKGSGAAIAGGCMFGGIVMNGYAVAHVGQGAQGLAARVYPDNHGGQVLFRERDVSNFLIDSFRFHHCWDPIRFASQSGNPVTIKDVTILKCWFTKIYDDVVENDTNRDGIVMNDCLVDGCFVLWSSRLGGGNNSNKTNVVQNSLIRMEKLYGTDYNAHDWYLTFKLASNSMKLDLFNNVFLIPGINADDFPNRPFTYDLMRFDKLRNSEGNVILWTGAGSYPAAVPPGFTVTHIGGAAASQWSNRRAAWIAANAQVPRIAGIDS